MIILILLFVILVYMVSASFIYNDTADRFSKNKEMYAMLGFMLPITPILLWVTVISISNLFFGHFPSIQVGETALMFSLVGYTLFVFMLPQFLSYRWRKSSQLQEIADASNFDQMASSELREPTYLDSPSDAEHMNA